MELVPYWEQFPPSLVQWADRGLGLASAYQGVVFPQVSGAAACPPFPLREEGAGLPVSGQCDTALPTGFFLLWTHQIRNLRVESRSSQENSLLSNFASFPPIFPPVETVGAETN